MPPRGVRWATHFYFAAKMVRKVMLSKSKMNGYEIMKLVFVSNYFNHHQKPFCEEMYQRLGENFVFVSTSVMREERRKLGYAEDDSPEYIILAHMSEQRRNEAIARIDEADVVVAGAAPNDMFLGRIQAGKLLLRYSERPYKKKTTCLKKAYHFFRWHQNDLWKNNVYMLCAGAYVARDYDDVGMYKNRTYKWGYFPAVKEYDIEQLLQQKKHNTIMWCGRFVDWKHPDDVIRVAQKLNESGYHFRLNMIGTGVMEDALKQFVAECNLTDKVFFLGAMPPEQVRMYMEEAGIYLFTSDRQEGWGAVLNESMNSGCAVVASHSIGAVPYLLNNDKNGLVYESGNTDGLYKKVQLLLDHPEKQYQLGSAAYSTIISEWNAKTAAERFLALAESLLKTDKQPDLYETGPCSRAEFIHDEWLKEGYQ